VNPRDANPATLAVPHAQIAQAELEFARDADGATYLSRQRVGYPFHVGKSLKLPGDPQGMPSVYLQSCSGGLFEGDNVRMKIVAGEKATAHVGTAAATVVHSMEDRPALQQVEIDAQADAFIEYLPDAFILFPRAKLSSSIVVRAHPSATVILGDAMLLHDPVGAGETFGWLQSDTAIKNTEGRLLVRDRFRVEGPQLSRGLAGVTGKWRAQASLFVVTSALPAADLVAALRAALALPGIYAGATTLPNQSGAWARMLATDAAALKPAVFAAWSAARKILTGAAPMPRRK
jgi:urease accessory protein